MLKRYFDAEATMGEARLLGETGPDEAGHTLTPTTVVIFGAKRWILWDHNRFKTNMTRQWRIVRPYDDEELNDVLKDRVQSSEVRSHVLSSPEWIKYLYPVPERQEEIRAHGHDCIQRAGELMFVPRRWMHSVINIGDTVSVISEVGHVKGEGKTAEDFAYDPYESSSDDEEEEEDETDLSVEEKIRRRGPPPEWLCADQNPNHPACIFCARNPDNPVCGDGFRYKESSSDDSSDD